MADVVVRRFCDRCQAYRDGPSTRNAGPPQSPILVCAVCGGALTAEQQRVAQPLTSALLGAFVFPFKPVVFGAVVGVALVSYVVQLIPLFGNALAATTILTTVFLALRGTAEGRDDLASEMELSDSFWLWFSPLIRYLLTLVVAYGPPIAALIILGWPAGAPIVIGLAALGTLYLPAGMIVAAHQEGCLGPLNPIPGARIIARIPGPYGLTLGFLLLSVVAGALLAYVAHWVAAIPVPIVTALIARLINLIAPLIMARQLGLLVREHGEEL
jgi:hypothetical protein